MMNVASLSELSVQSNLNPAAWPVAAISRHPRVMSHRIVISSFRRWRRSVPQGERPNPKGVEEVEQKHESQDQPDDGDDRFGHLKVSCGETHDVEEDEQDEQRHEQLNHDRDHWLLHATWLTIQTAIRDHLHETRMCHVDAIPPITGGPESRGAIVIDQSALRGHQH